MKTSNNAYANGIPSEREASYSFRRWPSHHHVFHGFRSSSLQNFRFNTCKQFFQRPVLNILSNRSHSMSSSNPCLPILTMKILGNLYFTRQNLSKHWNIHDYKSSQEINEPNIHIYDKTATQLEWVENIMMYRYEKESYQLK